MNIGIVGDFCILLDLFLITPAHVGIMVWARYWKCFVIYVPIENFKAWYDILKKWTVLSNPLHNI